MKVLLIHSSIMNTQVFVPVHGPEGKVSDNAPYAAYFCASEPFEGIGTPELCMNLSRCELLDDDGVLLVAPFGLQEENGSFEAGCILN